MKMNKLCCEWRSCKIAQLIDCALLMHMMQTVQAQQACYY